MTQPRWREWPPDIQSVLFLTVPVIPEWSFCFPTATTRFIWSVRTRRGTARYQLNSDLWPTGFPSALGVRDSLPVNKSAVIRGYKTGAVSFGLENAPGTYYQRLQINPNGTVVYYYLPEGATTLKTATLVHLEDLLWLCWRQQNSELSIESYKVTNWGCEIIKANYVRKYGKVVHVYFNFTVKADHVAPYISLFALPCKPISMMEVLPPFFRRIDGTQIPTRYLSDYGVIQSTYTLDVSSDYVFEWVFICE